MVGDGGYSAPLDFSTTPSGCEKSALLETSQSQNAIARFGLLRLNHLRRFSSKTTHFCQTKKTPLKVSFLFGGRWWIRTTEGLASRFTVCPLWPLGKSPIFYLMHVGAGGRTRTPDLLITNQLLYQLSYTSIFRAQIIYHTYTVLSSINFKKNNKFDIDN